MLVLLRVIEPKTHEWNRFKLSLPYMVQLDILEHIQALEDTTRFAESRLGKMA